MKTNAVNSIVLLLLQQYDAASRKRVLPTLKVLRNCIIALSLLILSNFSFAQSAWNNGGDGKTKATAYKISTPEQFRNFVSGVNASTIKTTHSEQCNNGSGWNFTADLVSYFELTGDIDLSELSPNKMAVLIHKKETSARYLYSGQWVDGKQLTEDKLVEGSESEVEANYLSPSFSVVSSYPYTWTSSETSNKFTFSDANSVNNETKTKEEDLGWSDGKHYKKKTTTEYSYSLIAYTDISFIKNFNGRFYGNGFVIKNLVVNEPNTDNVGLFGLVGSGQHSNMCDALKGDKTKTYKDFLASVESVGLENSMIIGKSNVGGIVGSSTYCEYVKDCFIKNTDVVGNTSVAGIIGLAGTSQYNDCTGTRKYCTIQGCYSLSDIDQEGNGKVTYHHFISGIGNSANYIGGITGGANQTVNIKDCYSVIGVRCGNSNGQFGPILGGEISANAEFDGIYFIKDWNVDGNTSGDSYDNTSKSNKDKYKENTEEAESMDELNSLLAADNENTLVADEYGINDGAPMTASQYQRFQGEGTLIPLYINKWNLVGSFGSTAGALTNNKGGKINGTGDVKSHDLSVLSVNDFSNYLYADAPTEIGYAYYVYPYAYTPYEYPDDWDGESTTLASGHDLLTGMPSVNGAEYTQLIRQSGSYANSDVAYSSKNPAVDGGVNYFGISNPFNSKMTVAKSDDNSIKNLVQGGTVYILNAYDGTWSNNINSEVEINGAQGFFAASQQEELNLILSYADKTIKSAAQNAPQSKSYQEDDASELITFEVRANNTLSKAYARVNSSAEDGFDKSDAYSLFALDNDKLAEPYFLVDNEKLLKNEFKSLPFVCALNFKVSNPAEVSLTVENANKDIEVSIIDAENDNRETVLGSNPFDFTANQGDNEGRFFVKFSKKNVGTEVLDAAENNITIRNENKYIYINGKGLKNVVVMNATGQIIYSSPVVGESHSFNLNAEAGLYLVKAMSESGGKTAKIVVD